jgi:hypothetical protein
MKVKIYENHGVLAHEKQSVYTTAPAATATLSEPIYILIPEDMHPYVTVSGEVALEVMDGFNPYLLHELLVTGHAGTPALQYVDRHGGSHTIYLNSCKA